MNQQMMAQLAAQRAAALDQIVPGQGMPPPPPGLGAAAGAEGIGMLPALGLVGGMLYPSSIGEEQLPAVPPMPVKPQNKVAEALKARVAPLQQAAASRGYGGVPLKAPGNRPDTMPLYQGEELAIDPSADPRLTGPSTGLPWVIRNQPIYK